jgi:hypothetical protein
MIGVDSHFHSFLLQRTDGSAPLTEKPQVSSAAKNQRHAIPPAAAAILRRNLPQLNELK